MSERPKLSPCPFCGGTNVTDAAGDCNVAIVCRDCDIRGPAVEHKAGDDVDETFAKTYSGWNTRSGPTWQDKPTVPGLWLCVPMKKANFGGGAIGLELTQGDIDKGAPFYTRRCYGPIPSDEAGGGK